MSKKYKIVANKNISKIKRNWITDMVFVGYKTGPVT